MFFSITQKLMEQMEMTETENNQLATVYTATSCR